jgi:hypothetical protein
MANHNFPKMRSFTWLSTLALGGGLLAGCGAEGLDLDPEVEKGAGAILGGTAVTPQTEAQQGLLLANLCSGALLDQNTAITATHCATLDYPSSNSIRAFGTDNQFKFRDVAQVIQVGTTDITLFKLAGPVPAGFPTVNRPVTATAGPSAVNTDVTCYGRGSTDYAPGGGFNGGNGSYRQLTRTLARYDAAENYLAFPSWYGWEVTAPGDSGGLCVTGNNAVGVVWRGPMECSNPATGDTCKATATKVLESHLSSLNKYKDYIDASKTRSMATFRPMTLSTTWKNSPYSTHRAGAALVNGFVYLRGAVSAGSSSTLFTLPTGYRPSHKVYLPINLVNSKKGRLIIETSGVVSVYPESGSMADAYNFTSLDGASFAVLSTPSTAATMLNGWGNTAYGTRPVAARADGAVIRLQGAMTTTGTNTTAFTLHSSFWPSTRVMIPVDMNGGTKGRIVIEPNGTGWVSVESGKPASNGFLFTSLEGVSYNKSSGGDAVALYNGWGVYPGMRTPTVANRNGIVNFQGTITTSGTNMAAMYIPEKYRPATDVYVEADLCNAKKGRVLIQPSGWVSVQYESAIGDAKCLTSLEGVQFGL